MWADIYERSEHVGVLYTPMPACMLMRLCVFVGVVFCLSVSLKQSVSLTSFLHIYILFVFVFISLSFFIY